MQQMYSCPNCNAPVAYGQPYCQNCRTVFNWQAPPAQGQYQSSAEQDRQQQQWQSSAPGSPPSGQPAQDQPRSTDGGPGLLQTLIDNRVIIAKIAAIAVAAAALIGAGLALQGQIAKWFAAPVLVSFEPSSPAITAGQEATLQWQVVGANSVSISPGIGTVPSSGARTVSPGTTTIYTLVAGNPFGSVRKSITVAVTGVLPAINSFSIDPGNIFTGQSATVSWDVEGSTSVSIAPELGTVSPSGTRTISPGSTTRYVLSAANSAGTKTASATLTVTSSNAPIVTTFAASPDSIKSGEVSTLTWDIIGAKSIMISQGIGGVASKGSAPVTPAATTTYTVTAASDYGSVTRTVTVVVDTSGTTNTANTAITKDPPVVNTFSASRDSIMLGDNITLTWAVEGARTVSISPGIGNVPSSGWMMVIPTATTTYQLSAVNTFGTETAEAPVTVNTEPDGVAPLIRAFTATPGSISEGGTSSLTWDIKGATLLIIDQSIGIPASKYSQPVSPAVTTSYSLTAINSYGTDNATVTVNVVP